MIFEVDGVLRLIGFIKKSPAANTAGLFFIEKTYVFYVPMW